MFVFRGEGSKELLFDAVFLVEKSGNTVSDVDVVFPDHDDYSAHFKNLIKTCAFPLIDSQGITWDTDMTVHFIRDHNGNQYYIYTQYYILTSKYLTISFITKYHHFRLFSALFSTITSQVEKRFYRKASKIKFKLEDFDIKPKKDEMNLSMGVSPASEIAYLHYFFLSNYPPALIGTLISLICAGRRIFVVSSSTSKITQTVFAIASFFYPVVSAETFYPLLVHDNVASAFKIYEGVVGIHSTSFLSISEQIETVDVVFNCDDIYISCQRPPKYKSWLNTEIASFAQSIRNATMNYSPAFPSNIVKTMISEFLILYLTKLFGCPRNPDAILGDFKRYSSNGDRLEHIACRTPIIKEFMRMAKNREEVMEVFWRQPQPPNVLQRKIYHKEEEEEETFKDNPPRELGKRGMSFIRRARQKTK